MNTKIVAIAVIAVLAVAGIGVGIYAMNNNDTAEKKGLYRLNADILEVDMGGMGGTPKMVETIEYMYESVYGDLTDNAKKKTLADAKADKEFWDKYAKYDSLVTVDGGNVTYRTIYDSSNHTKDVTLSAPATKLIGTGSAYGFAIYALLCVKYNVEQFSDAAKNNADLVAEFQALNWGGLKLSSISNSSPELAKYYSSSYVEACTSIGNYDLEKLTQNVKDASAAAGGSKVILMAAASTSLDYEKILGAVESEGRGVVLFNNAKSIPTTLTMIEEIAYTLGYGSYVDQVIEDLQLRTYKVYCSVKELTAADPDKTYKAYFEGNSGKAASKTSNGKALCDFFGWDTSLFDGAEHDTESLLAEKPNIIIFYTNDTRTDDERMRALEVQE